MNSEELIKKIRCGETSRVQFKQQFTTQKEIAADMVAFANCEGGELLFGVVDKTGEIIGFRYSSRVGRLLTAREAASSKRKRKCADLSVEYRQGERECAVQQ